METQDIVLLSILGFFGGFMIVLAWFAVPTEPRRKKPAGAFREPRFLPCQGDDWTR